jgi:anthranilate phosphoribosyltransferase
MAGMARAMKGRAVAVDAGDDVLDIVGTGGDDAGTVNISTGSCVLAAAAGAKVAKARPTSLRRSLSFSNETSTSSND